MFFAVLISILILQRLLELVIARRNEKWLLKNGAVEYGQRFYPVIVALHTFFIASLITEYIVKQKTGLSVLFLFIYIALVALKVWTISSLGNYWNTKIFRVPGSAPVNKGPYKFLKHPNYIIVIGEIAVIPLIFHLYFTAVVFSILNLIVLNTRIKEENRVWGAE